MDSKNALAKYAYNHARKIIKGRWPVGEPFIACSGWFSYCYAKFVIHQRFELGEPAIFETIWSKNYAKKFMPLVKDWRRYGF